MRIASIAKSNTEILKSLGGVEKEIVCATTYDREILSGINFETIGSYVDIDIQKVISLKPDIVFSSTFLQKKYYDGLRENGINAVHLIRFRLMKS